MSPASPIRAELVAVVAAVTRGAPRILTTHGGRALPAGPFADGHRSLQTGLRAWVQEQTRHPLGYVEQLYTFADPGRTDRSGTRVISVSYLALTLETSPGAEGVAWRDWYHYFPWEERRHGEPELLLRRICPPLQRWAQQAPSLEAHQRRAQRCATLFGLDGAPWNEDLVLQRYELLYEAGLLPESARGGHITDEKTGRETLPGAPMEHDHRRILATGMARLRAKIKYCPLVYELLPPEFTLLQLQLSVEALAGRPLHKQNFRRLVEQQNLLEETGRQSQGGPGRPARTWRFRSRVLHERGMSGSKLPLARSD